MTKYEIRISHFVLRTSRDESKFETNSNFQNTNDKNVWNIRILNFVYFVSDLMLRASNLVLVLLVFTNILLPTPVNAQSISLSIWPPLLEVMIQPGRSVTQVYKLTNNSDQPLQITPQIYSFRPQGERGEIKINLAKGGSNFFSFDSSEQFGTPFYLPVGQTKELILKISIPPKTAEHDYYSTLLFATGTVSDDSGHSSTSSVTQIGSNILLTVSQNGKPNLLARILEFSTTKIIDSFSAASFKVRLENWGQTFFKPFGKIYITGILKQKDEIELLPQNILGESVRNLDTSLYKPKLPLGLFKAKLEFSTSESTSSAFNELSAETVFLYLPYKLFLAAGTLTIMYLFAKKLLKKESK